VLDVLALGFSELCSRKPDFPIKYLGQWLMQYASLQNAFKNLPADQEKGLLLKKRAQEELLARKSQD
jgi:hypothetical protein